MEELLKVLAKLPTGPINDSSKSNQVESLLSECWSQFEGASDTGMKREKLWGRSETVHWDPPFLSFKIERHGGTVMGSSRAQLYEWIVNTKAKTAHCREAGYRQVDPTAKRVYVKPIAAEIANLIINGSDDKRLIWDDNKTSVKLVIREILPDNAATQTITERRKKFRQECTRLVEEAGWTPVRANFYEKKTA